MAQASFQLGPAAGPVLAALTAQAGSPALETRVFGPLPRPVAAQATLVHGEAVLWLVNETGEKQPVLVGELGEARACALVRFIGETPAAGPVLGEGAVAEGILRVELKPYEVCEVNLGRKP